MRLKIQGNKKNTFLERQTRERNQYSFDVLVMGAKNAVTFELTQNFNKG